MIIDRLLTFGTAQAVTAAAASTDSIDLGAIRDIGTGEPLYVVVVCTTAMTDTGSDSTLAVTLETDDNSSFSSVASFALGTFPAVSAAGTVLIARLNPLQANERFAQLRYTPANGNLTTGSFSAFIVKDIQRYVSYADAITIS